MHNCCYEKRGDFGRKPNCSFPEDFNMNNRNNFFDNYDDNDIEGQIEEPFEDENYSYSQNYSYQNYDRKVWSRECCPQRRCHKQSPERKPNCQNNYQNNCRCNCCLGFLAGCLFGCRRNNH